MILWEIASRDLPTLTRWLRYQDRGASAGQLAAFLATLDPAEVAALDAWMHRLAREFRAWVAAIDLDELHQDDLEP